MLKKLLYLLTVSCLLAAPKTFADVRTDVNVAAPWEISGIDPATDGYIFQRMAVMETLINTDENGALAPGLATQWSASGDGLTWSFTLRDASFHDGTSLTAEAAVTALSRAAKQPGPLSKAPIKQISADGNSVIFELESAYVILPAILAHSTAMIPAPSSFDAQGNVVAAIGTGPFKVDELSPPQSLTTSRFNDYWGEAAKISNVSYLATKRAETRALMAESGDADIVFTLDPSGFKRRSAVDTVQARAVAIPRVMLLKVNASHPMLDSQSRRALSLAIDREGIAAGIIRFPDAAATQVFPPALDQWHDKSLKPLSYDPESAKSILAGLGWAAGEDGILTRDGERFSLTLRTFPDRPELPLVGAALQDQWREIGVELEISVSSYSEIPAGHQDGSLEVALYARNYGSSIDPTGAAQADFGAGGGDWGAMNWESPVVVEAIDTIAATADAAVRNPLIKQVVTEIHNDLPLIPVAWYQHTVSFANGLEGAVVDPLERTYGLETITWAK